MRMRASNHTSGAARALTVAALITCSLAGGFALTGCSGTPTTVISRPESANDGGLSAIERGAARRDALQTAKDGLAAFDAVDHELMRSYFEDSFVDADVQRIAGYTKEGRTRHRDREITYVDATEMSKDGGSVTVSVRAVDNSYFVEADGSKTKPSGEEINFELRLTRQEDDSYRIVQIIGGSEASR